jgi:hypothetical protein
MAGGAGRAQNALQCLRGAVQVWSARARVPSGQQPDVLSRGAFEFAQEDTGDEEAQVYGDGDGDGNGNGSEACG